MNHKKIAAVLTGTTLLILLAVTSTCTRNELPPALEIYKAMQSMSNDSVYKRACNFLAVNQDSALLNYAVYIDRWRLGQMDKKDAERVVSAYINSGLIYQFHCYDYQKAFTYFSDAEALSREYELKEALVNSYANISRIYMVNNLFGMGGKLKSEAFDYSMKAYRAAVEIKDWPMVVMIVNNLVDYAVSNRSVEDVLPMIDEFEQMNIPANTELLQYVRHFLDGVKLQREGKLAAALGKFRAMETSANTEMYPEQCTIQSLHYQSEVLMQLGREAEALKLMDREMDLAKATGDHNTICDIYKRLYDNYSPNDTAKAQHYKVLYYESRDSVLFMGKLQSISEMRFVNDLDKAKTEMLHMEQKRRRELAVLLVVGISLLIAAALIVVIIRKNRALRKKNEILYANYDTLLKKEEENSRLLQEPHGANAPAIPAAPFESEPPSKRTPYMKDLELAQELEMRIRKAMSNTESICKTDFSLDKLADQVDSTSRIVSEVINDRFMMNFYALLNDYRIKEACRRLRDEENYGKFTIEAIAMSVGYKSRSNFVNVFQRVVGMAPSSFRKISLEKIRRQDQ